MAKSMGFVKKAGCRSLAGGFTLVELVAVLVLVAILAVVAAAHVSDGNAPALAEAELLKSALRYAQSRAMDDVSTWGIAVAGDGASYRLFTNNPTITSPTLPGGGSALHALPDGVRLAVAGGVADTDGTLGTCQSVVFDFRGRPVAAGGIADGAANGSRYLPDGTPPAPLDHDITATIAGSPQLTVTISRQTGFAR